MCIAMLNISGLMPQSHFDNSFNDNPHGMGLLYGDGNRMVFHKQMADPSSFYKEYVAVRRKHPNTPIAIHFRFATHGRTDLDNCHPFLVDASVGFIHNGILDVEDDEEISDTRVFNERFLKVLPSDFIWDETLVRVISNASTGSKLVFLDYEGNYLITGERAGHWDAAKVNWYSNHCYAKSESRFFPRHSHTGSVYKGGAYKGYGLPAYGQSQYRNPYEGTPLEDIYGDDAFAGDTLAGKAFGGEAFGGEAFGGEAFGGSGIGSCRFCGEDVGDVLDGMCSDCAYELECELEDREDEAQARLSEWEEQADYEDRGDGGTGGKAVRIHGRP